MTYMNYHMLFARVFEAASLPRDTNGRAGYYYEWIGSTKSAPHVQRACVHAELQVRLVVTRRTGVTPK